MPWPKGTTKCKTGGRGRGTPNKKTLVLRDVLESLNCDVPKRIVELLPELSLDKQADILVEMMRYLFPVRKAIEHSGPEGGPIAVEHQRKYMLRILAEPDLMNAAQTIAERLASDSGEEN